MKHDDIQICYRLVVFCLKNILVEIELKCVMPIVCVGEVFDRRVGGEFVCAVGFCYFATSFPVVDGEGGGVYDFIYHINRSCDSRFFVEYRPLCSVGSEGGGGGGSNVFVMEVHKVLEVWVGGLGGGGGVGWRIIKAFYLVMHRRSFCRRVLSSVRPHFFYFFGRFPVIFGIGDGVVPFLLVPHH